MKKTIILALMLFPLLAFAQNKDKSIWFPQGDGISSYMYEYKYLIDKGFYITESNSVSFNYTPIGHIELIAKRYFTKVEKGDPEYEKYGELSEIDAAAVKNGHPIEVYDFPSIYKIFDQILEKGKLMGANGLINFKIDYKYNSSAILPSHIYVSGMFIKK